MMGGRRITGVIQAAIMIIGFALALGYGLMYLSAVYKFVLDGTASEAKWKSIQPPVWMLLWGFGLCAVAWFWSLFSSFQILHESRRNQSL